MLDNLRSKDAIVTVRVPTRVDSFNFVDFSDQIQKVEMLSEHLVFDASTTQFLNLAAIKLLEFTAQKLSVQGREVVLYGASEKLKQQIRVFASLKGIRTVSASEWKDLVNTSSTGQA